MTGGTLLVLGADGLAGSAITRIAVRVGLHVVVTSRGRARAGAMRSGDRHRFVVGQSSLAQLLAATKPASIVNAIGATRQRSAARGMSDADAWRVNADFPRELGEAAEVAGVRLLHISTDCVFSGGPGPHSERAVPQPTDLYAASKLAGEAMPASALVIRTSFVGPLPRGDGLMAWLAAQQHGAVLRGFTDQQWNGITTDALGSLVTAWASGRFPAAGLLHLFSSTPMSKYALLIELSRRLERSDLVIEPVPSGAPVDRTLGSVRNDDLLRWWSAIGHTGVPAFSAL